MELAAVTHIAGSNYCYPINDNELVIKIKTGYDIDRVELMYGDPFESGLFGGEDSWSGQLIEMGDVKKLQYHLLWKAVVKPEFKRCRYFFILHSKNETFYMTEDSFMTEKQFKEYKGRRQDFFFPWMNPADIIKPASWVNETVWYQIFPDRFCNSGAERPFKFKKWSKPDKKVGILGQYGGDLNGIESKLEYLRDLGITGIYLNPICESPSNHKYNITDYKKIDPTFGSNEDMKRLTAKAHSLGIRIMVDGVFNHCGYWFAPWQDVLKNGERSKYYNWFMINKPIIKEYSAHEKNENSKNGVYYSFAFADSMPKLNTNNPEVADYFADVCRYWVQEFDIDAIRLDVANETSHFFNKQLRKAVFELKSDFYICGEIWHNSLDWLRGDEFDSVMNYSLQESIDSFWANPDETAHDFEHKINKCLNMYPEQVCSVMFNLLDSHDTMRLITRCGGNENEFYQRLCAMLAMNGTACIYYGTEIILPGGFDPDCRRCMPWEEINSGLYNDKISTMKQLINMRKSCPELRNGEIRFLPENKGRIIAFEKYSCSRTIRIVINCSNEEYKIKGLDNIMFARGFKNDCVESGGVVIAQV